MSRHSSYGRIIPIAGVCPVPWLSFMLTWDKVEPALAYARLALETAPTDQQEQIKRLIEQLGGTP